MQFTAKDIASIIGGRIEGDANVSVSSFSKIEEGKPGTLTFLANLKYEHYIYDTKASIVLVNEDFRPAAPIPSTLIRVENAYAALAQLMQMVNQKSNNLKGVEQGSFVHPTAQVGEDCFIGTFAYIGEASEVGNRTKVHPFAYIGRNVRIGEGCIIHPHVSIMDDTIIGNDCILHPGAVIGADGFGFAPNEGRYDKIPQLGNVIIENNVEIGANTCVDRSVMDATIIREGVKLDNLIQIAHNCEVGENTVMAAQVGLAGSVKVGTHCMFGGQSGLAGHLTIGDNVSIGAQSGIISDVESNRTVIGSPSMEIKSFFRSMAIVNKLPEIYRTLHQLQREVETLKKAEKK